MTFVPPPATPAPTAIEGTQQTGREYFRAILSRYGLQDLLPTIDQMITNDAPERDILQAMRDSEPYKRRFPGMAERQKKGLPAMSEEAYLEWETTAKRTMMNAGLPTGFYDQPGDFARFIGNDVSPQEFETRVVEGWAAASNAPRELRDELDRLYGVGPGELTAFFLDPDRGMAEIEKKWAASQISGQARLTGFGGLNQQEAERLQALGTTASQASQAFSQLREQRELFGGLPGQGEDQISRQEQLAAAFEGSAPAMERIERRRRNRQATFEAGGGFAGGQEGVAGLGTA